MENALTTVSPQTPVVVPPAGLTSRLVALPARGRWMAAIGVAALVAVLVALTLAGRSAEYRVLFANLAERDGAQVVEKLAQMNVPYRISDGSGTIQVPAAQVYEVRMKLSNAGLPKGSVNGYELLDKTPFGQTQGQEQKNQQRALEGELVRTIQSLGSVESARVHLALPQANGFFREQSKPSASVKVTLHPGRTLDAKQIAGIVHLVSASVPDLHAKAVTVVDGNLDLLTGSGEPSMPNGLDAQQLKHLRDVEANHTKRVMELLEPMFGRDNVRVTVSADIDFSQVQATAEEYKPNQGDAAATVRAVRSEESTAPNSAVPAGVPGAISNQPPTPASAPIAGSAQALRAGIAGGAGSGARREQETRYEVDKKVSVTHYASGVVRRLNAAVVVNHRSAVDAKGKPASTPLSEQELEKVTALVQQGIGFNKERGDSVRVVNTPFHVVAAAPVEPLPTWKEPWLQDLVRSAAIPTALSLVALALVFGIIRPALKPAFTPPAAEATPPTQPVHEVVGGDASLPALEVGALPQLPAPGQARVDALRALAKENPAAVANVLRSWVNGEAA